MDDPWLNRKHHVDSTQQIFWTLFDPIKKFHTDEFKWPSFGFSRNFQPEFQIISEFWKLEIFNWQQKKQKHRRNKTSEYKIQRNKKSKKKESLEKKLKEKKNKK